MNLKRVVLLASIIALLSLGAFAGTTSGSLSVTSNVTAACSLSSGNTLAFGAYDPTSSSDLAGSGTFSMTCTNGSAATLLLGQGANANTGSTEAAPLRQMDNAGTKMGYQLYSDSGDNTVWGNTTGTGVSQTATGSAQTIHVYGKIPKNQAVIAGSYADTVVITLNF